MSQSLTHTHTNAHTSLLRTCTHSYTQTVTLFVYTHSPTHTHTHRRSHKQTVKHSAHAQNDIDARSYGRTHTDYQINCKSAQGPFDSKHAHKRCTQTQETHTNSHGKHTRKKIPVYSQRQDSFSFELLPTPVVIHVPRQLYSFIHPFPVSLLCSCAPTTDDFFASEWPAAGTGRLVAVGKKIHSMPTSNKRPDLVAGSRDYTKCPPHQRADPVRRPWWRVDNTRGKLSTEWPGPPPRG